MNIGVSEERMNETQVKKPQSCRGLAFCKVDSKRSSSQERCGSFRLLARLARKPGSREGIGRLKQTGLEVESANPRLQRGSTPLSPGAQRDDITYTAGSSLEGLHQGRAEGLPEQARNNSLLL